MRDLPKSSLRVSSASPAQVTVNRKGDVTSYRVGRARAQGDTRNAQGKYIVPHRPMEEHLERLHERVAGIGLTPEEAAKWAVKMRHGFKKRT